MPARLGEGSCPRVFDSVMGEIERLESRQMLARFGEGGRPRVANLVLFEDERLEPRERRQHGHQLRRLRVAPLEFAEVEGHRRLRHALKEAAIQTNHVLHVRAGRKYLLLAKQMRRLGGKDRRGALRRAGPCETWPSAHFLSALPQIEP